MDTREPLLPHPPEISIPVSPSFSDFLSMDRDSSDPLLPSSRARNSINDSTTADISIPISPAFKDLLIFGPSISFSNLPSPSAPAPTDPSSPLPRRTRSLHRSRTAPAMAPIDHLLGPHRKPLHPIPPPPARTSLFYLCFLLLSLYLSFGVAVYSLNRHHFSATPTHPLVDAFYFCIVTMCTIGYGDITPLTPLAKLFSVFFVLAGFGFLDVLLSSMVSQLLDAQEAKFFKRDAEGRVRHDTLHCIVADFDKGRLRIRIKVGAALFTVVLCIGIGTVVLCMVEKLGWVDAFYLSVMSVTTVGYGDRAFKTLPGRIFASVWLLVSTLAVARAFIILTEARIEKRNRMKAKYALHRDLTVSEFIAADIDNNGFISKSEFVVYKLKEMEKITPKEIKQICDLFEQLDKGSRGKITVSDLINSQQ